MSNLVSATLHGSAAFEDGKTPSADLEKIKNNKILLRAVVIDVLSDVSLYDSPPESLSDSNKILFSKAPRNSIVCRLLTETNQQVGQDVICFPFFSSHLSLPIKPGEQVWVLNELFFSQTLGPNRTYWLSRVTEELALEDCNYTFFNRNISQKITSSIDPQSVLQSDTKIQNLETKSIFEKSKTKNLIIKEPVPRYTKRPSDLVLQGSNNTLISLGQERGYDFDVRPNFESSSDASKPSKEKSGTIDIVAGRGRYFFDNENEIKSDRKNSSLGSKNSTKPFVSKNNFEKYEVDKNPGRSQSFDYDNNPIPGNAKTNPKEGDPDFVVDASRIYISENCDGDKKIGTSSITDALFEGELLENQGPFVIVKSDNVRIVARNLPNNVLQNKLPDGFSKSDGSIRLIKEGNDDDKSSMFFEKDGTIQISGKKIFIGKPNAGSGPGPSGSEPYIKYSKFQELWEQTMDALTNFCDKVLTHVTPGYGNPSLQINDAANELKTKLSQIKSDVQTVKSDRIFGE